MDMGPSSTAEATDRRLALHLLPVDVGRGAQRYAMSLRDQLDGNDWEHRIMVMFRSESRAVEADDDLDVPQGRLRRFGFDPRVVWRLRRRLRANPPDVLVAHGGEPFKYARLAAPPDTRLLYYRIGVSQPQSQHGLRRLFYRLLARRANLVAGVSLETLDDAHDVMGIPRDRLELVPNGRDAEGFEAARSARSSRTGAIADPAAGSQPSGDSRTDPSPHLIWVGALTPGKRPDWFVRLVARLRADGLEVRASLVGDGPMREELRQPAADAGVEVLGHRDDIPELLVDADVFCFTSSGESEGMPGVLIEAGLAGLATVATAVPGASTVIEEGITGHVVPIDDFDALVGAAGGLVRSAEARTAMGEAALARCAVDFTLTASANRFRETLNKLVNAG